MTPIELHDVLKQRAEDINRVAGPTGLVAVAQDEVLQILSALRAVEGAKVALKWIAGHATTDEGDVDENAEEHGLDAQEFMEMAHDNLIDRARTALTHLEGLK